MSPDIQSEAISLLIDLITYLIPFSVLISVSYLFINIFKLFIRGK